MSAGIKANNDGSAAIQVGGSDYIEISAAGDVTIPQNQNISGNLTVTGSITAGSGTVYNLEQYTSPATWTKPASLKAIKVTVVGDGGNGGACPGPSTTGAAAGGGGGGAAIAYIPAPSIPGPVAITAGPGTNSFGAFCSATGGGNGNNAQTNGIAGVGGLGSGGDININGGGGGSIGAGGAGSGAGGSSILGGGGAAVSKFSGPGVTAGQAGGNYGGGGGGAAKLAPSAASASGGTGAPGIVIVEEFY